LGASNPTGTLGYAFAMEELLSQGLNVDWIIVPSSSAGTQAGMVLGAKRAGWDGKILGISIDVEKKELQEKVADLATQASVRLGEKIRILPDEIIVNTDYLGDGYAVMGNIEIDAINLLGRTEGLVVGPVYTGRSAAGMIDLIQKGFFKQEETVLFWHTGDNSTIFADPYAGQLSQ
jgi:1-aminocyclopropane-1-carboxylate deaminase/D-cysteine desulfhydrase-like pyridoxal-dependent ACC family enzyme